MSKNLIPEEQRTDTANQAKKDILKQIGKRIRQYRKGMGYSQQNLASDISKINIIPDAPDLSEKTISRYETGVAEMGIIAFINICRGLQRTPNELLKDYISDIESKHSEILVLYEQLGDGNKILAEHYLRLLLFGQSNGGISTLK